MPAISAHNALSACGRQVGKSPQSISDTPYGEHTAPLTAAIRHIAHWRERNIIVHRAASDNANVNIPKTVQAPHRNSYWRTRLSQQPAPCFFQGAPSRDMVRTSFPQDLAIPPECDRGVPPTLRWRSLLLSSVTIGQDLVRMCRRDRRCSLLDTSFDFGALLRGLPLSHGLLGFEMDAV
jgi:hypothetical protein